MAWRRSGDKPLSEPMMVSLLTQICVTWPQWVKGIIWHKLMNNWFLCYKFTEAEWHIYVSKLAIIVSDNGLSGWCQTIIWTNAGILSIGPLATNKENLIEICIYSFKKMHLRMSSGNWPPFCLSNVLIGMASHSDTYCACSQEGFSAAALWGYSQYMLIEAWLTHNLSIKAQHTPDICRPQQTSHH